MRVGNSPPKVARAAFLPDPHPLKFNEIAGILDTHPVTAGRCAEKGRELVDRDEGIWEILEKRS